MAWCVRVGHWGGKRRGERVRRAGQPARGALLRAPVRPPGPSVGRARAYGRVAWRLLLRRARGAGARTHAQPHSLQQSG
eukprot:2782550-Pleurochrysis_carterae.AAC.1